MKSILISFIVLLSGAFLFASGQNQNAGSETITVKQDPNLNNKTFKIKLTITKGERKGWKWINDEISFKTNSLLSKIMSEKERFASADCKITISQLATTNVLSFEGTMKNPGVSKIEWNGKVEGDKITGTAVWTYASGTTSYSFMGALKK